MGFRQKILAEGRQNGRVEIEGWRVRKDGSRFFAAAVIHKVQDRRGRHVGFAKVTRDITERKAAEEALLQSESRFRLLVQGVIDYAIYLLDPSGVVTNWNAGAERIKGYAADEIIGQHLVPRALPRLVNDSAAVEETHSIGGRCSAIARLRERTSIGPIQFMRV